MLLLWPYSICSITSHFFNGQVARARASLLQSAVLNAILEIWFPCSAAEIKVAESFCCFVEDGGWGSVWFGFVCFVCFKPVLSGGYQAMSHIGCVSRGGAEHDVGNFCYCAFYGLLLAGGNHLWLQAYADRWPSILGFDGRVQCLFLCIRVFVLPVVNPVTTLSSIKILSGFTRDVVRNEPETSWSLC